MFAFLQGYAQKLWWWKSTCICFQTLINHFHQLLINNYINFSLIGPLINFLSILSVQYKWMSPWRCLNKTPKVLNAM
jgi:hypothetical protein